MHIQAFVYRVPPDLGDHGEMEMPPRTESGGPALETRGASIDLNADVGESFGPWPMGHDEALMSVASTVNVACGFHAGDPVVISKTIDLAVRSGLAMGAHPGYPDREGFGRRDLAMSSDELEASVLYQVAAVAGMVQAAGGRLAHVKAHGALYNRAAVDAGMAAAIARAVWRFSRELILVGPPGSELLAAAEAIGLPTAAEGFADRAYEPDGSLRSRRLEGALLTDPAARGSSGSRPGPGGPGPDAVRALGHPGCSGDRPSRALGARGGRLRRPTRDGLCPGMSNGPMIETFGDRAFLVVLGGGINPRVNGRVHALAEAVRTEAAQGVAWGNPVPSYESVVVPFDPLLLDAEEAQRRLNDLLAVTQEQPRIEPKTYPTVEIPTLYGGEDGPDLPEVARRLGLAEHEVVARHAAHEYLVYMMGFTPGYAYLGLLPKSLELPRRDVPRVRVASGSVGIAGRQTGVYPTESPGGFHIIGRTDLVLWDPAREPPCLLEPGRRVRFVEITG